LRVLAVAIRGKPKGVWLSAHASPIFSDATSFPLFHAEMLGQYADEAGRGKTGANGLPQEV